MYRGHRTVVLPDFQGVGIGHKFSNWVAEYFIKHGKRYVSTTSNTALIHARCKDAKWVLKEMPKRKNQPKNAKVSKISFKSNSSNRITASFEYIGNKQ